MKLEKRIVKAPNGVHYIIDFKRNLGRHVGKLNDTFNIKIEEDIVWYKLLNDPEYWVVMHDVFQRAYQEYITERELLGNTDEN